jgi:anaerobic dimethyl sulfoxide reductase subunit A
MTGRKEEVVTTMCASHCGGNCLLKVHVRDGVITRVETDDGPEPQLRACQRGRALRQRVYDPGRILHPLKRVGERGEGRFEQISWDEALDTVASQLKRVRETYGPISILYLPMAGDLGVLHSVMVGHRLLALAGGYTTWWGATSFQAGLMSEYYTFGTICCSNSRDSLLHSRLIIAWGWDPAKTIQGTNTTWYLARAKEAGTKIVAVDPFYNETAAAFAREWIPIRPGTDAAMLIAMAYVIVEKDLQDRAFLDRYTVGFARFRDYVLGVEDGLPKTPAWAEAITGVPASTIERLAVEYALAKPAALMAGIGPGRTAFGEQYHRAASVLATMTGNVGVLGGDAGGRAWVSVVGGYPYRVGLGSGLPFARNPIDDLATWDGVFLGKMHPRIHYAKMADAILKGRAGGYPADYKLALIVNCNYVNALPNTNKTVRALKSLEFIADVEQHMTATARYADIILPSSTYVEREDIVPGAVNGYYGFQRKIIEPLGESRPHNEIFKALAERMGILDYDTQGEEERLRSAVAKARIPDYEAFKEKALYWVPRSGPYVAFKDQIEDPENHPFPTPSGKIEIYSERLAAMNDPLLPPVPKYIETWEGVNDPLARKYPIQLVTPHDRRRANAQFDNLPWLREQLPQAVSMSKVDAESRGIKDGDMVRVFNDRGETRIQARVTSRIMPGVASLPEGAWYDPDEDGVDRAGHPNVLTSDEPSPGGAFPYNSVLVQIERL